MKRNFFKYKSYNFSSIIIGVEGVRQVYNKLRTESKVNNFVQFPEKLKENHITESVPNI